MKTIIKNIICSILYYTGISSLMIRVLLRKKRNLPVVILIYHRISEDPGKEINANLTINHPVRNFVREMAFIKKHFNVVNFDTAVEQIKKNLVATGPVIAVTFDDGFADNYKSAFPVLKALNIPVTIFLTAGVIGTDELPWAERIGEVILQTKERQLSLNSCFQGTIFNLETLHSRRVVYNRITSKLKELDYNERIQLVDEIVQKTGGTNNSGMRMLSWQEIDEMSKNNVSFGAHSMTHPILSKMSLELAKKEINDSRLAIEKALGTQVKHFAFPNGRPQDFTAQLREYCQEIGFQSVSTAVYGNNQPGADVYALKRISPGRNIPVFAVDLIRGFLRK